MSRPKKKPNYNPDQVMQEFMAAVADAFGSYDDREDTTFPGLNAVATEFGITALNDYYGAAEPPVRCGESHLSGLTEPPVDNYSA